VSLRDGIDKRENTSYTLYPVINFFLFARGISMIEYGIFFKILLIFSLALISPGPDFMIVSSMSLARGRADGIKCAAGTTVGISVYVWVSLTGLSALFARNEGLATAIKLCGGIYLLYLGFSMWRASLEKRQAEIKIPANVKRRNAFLTGALTNLTNAKAVAFFSSIFAFVLTPDMSLATKIALATAIPLVNFLWFSFVAFCLSKEKVRSRYQRAQGLIDRVVGSVLAFFGAELFLSAFKFVWAFI
jgi:threonine efflux protein